MAGTARLRIFGIFLLLFGLFNVVIFGIFQSGSHDPAFLWMGEIAILAGFALLFVTWGKGTSPSSSAAGPGVAGRHPRLYSGQGSGRDPLDNINDYLFGKQAGGGSQGAGSRGMSTSRGGGDALSNVNDFLYGTGSHQGQRGDETPPDERDHDDDGSSRRDPLENINDYLFGTRPGDRSRNGSQRRDGTPPDEGDPEDDYDDDYDDGYGRDPLENINDYLFGRQAGGRSRRER